MQGSAHPPQSHFKTIQPWQRILGEVAEKHSISVALLRSPKRRALLALPRREAMYRLNRELGFSHRRIARMFSRDHTSVGYAIRTYAASLNPEPVPCP